MDFHLETPLEKLEKVLRSLNYSSQIIGEKEYPGGYVKNSMWEGPRTIFLLQIGNEVYGKLPNKVNEYVIIIKGNSLWIDEQLSDLVEKLREVSLPPQIQRSRTAQEA